MKTLDYNPTVAWIKDRVMKNKNAIIVVNGPTGSGKTYLALELALEVGQALGTTFSVNKNMDFNFLKLLEKTMNPELNAPGTSFLFEEVGAAGSGSASRQWQSQANQFFFSFAQTSRHRNQIFIMTCPYFSNLDNGVRKLCHMQIEMKGIDHRKKISYAKPYLIQVNSRTGKIYFKYPRLKIGGRKLRVKQLSFKCPPPEVCKEYEDLKTKYTTELNAGFIKSDGEKNKPKEPPKTNQDCPYCQYKWTSRTKTPKQCPKCTKWLEPAIKVDRKGSFA